MKKRSDFIERLKKLKRIANQNRDLFKIGFYAGLEDAFRRCGGENLQWAQDAIQSAENHVIWDRQAEILKDNWISALKRAEREVMT